MRYPETRGSMEPIHGSRSSVDLSRSDPCGMLYPMKRWSSAPRWGMGIVGLTLLPGAFVTAFAADSPIVGAWQLDSGESAQAALYLFTPTHYSMVLAATDRPDMADTSTATAHEL